MGLEESWEDLSLGLGACCWSVTPSVALDRPLRRTPRASDNLRVSYGLVQVLPLIGDVAKPMSSLPYNGEHQTDLRSAVVFCIIKALQKDGDLLAKQKVKKKKKEEGLKHSIISVLSSS